MNTKIINRLNKVPSLPNISTFRPKIKKNISTNNVSSTTNASGDRNINSYNNSSIINKSQNSNKKNKNILLHKIKLNNSKSQRSISKNWILPDSINTQKGTLEILKNADEIMKERIINHDKEFAMRKKKLKSIALKISKRIGQKNYLINSLKQRRTEINDKEIIIKRALKNFEMKLELDNRKFIKFIEEVKEKQKKEDKDLIDLRNIRIGCETKL